MVSYKGFWKATQGMKHFHDFFATFFKYFGYRVKMPKILSFMQIVLMRLVGQEQLFVLILCSRLNYALVLA